MIVIVDYKLGNLNALQNSIRKIGYEATITSDITQIKNATKLILAGVGHFAKAIENINLLNLKDIIKEKVLIHKTPIIGICLGMQLLTDFSEEGQVDGLSLIKAKTLKFSFSDNTIKIPHVGWNNIKIKRQNILLENIPDDAQFYFTHSYYVTCEKEDNIVATTNYGHDFDSIINNENIWGVQFHPEKSHKQGLDLLKNFIENA